MNMMRALNTSGSQNRSPSRAGAGARASRRSPVCPRAKKCNIRSAAIFGLSTPGRINKQTTTVSKNLRNRFISRVNQMKIKAQSKCTQSMEEITCSVCKLSFLDPYQLIPCKHTFCNWCLTEWLKQNASCPVCRARPQLFERNTEAAVQVKEVGGSLSESRREELGFGRATWDQQYCLLKHKMSLPEFLDQVPESAAAKRESQLQSITSFNVIEWELAVLRHRMRTIQEEQEQVLRRRRRRIHRIVERFENELDRLDREEEMVNLEIERHSLNLIDSLPS